MAGTVTIEETTHTSVKEIIFTWTSDAAGDADGTTVESYDGEVLGVVTVPTTTPTADYDVVLNNDASIDILFGAGANRSNSAIETISPIGGDTNAKPIASLAGTKLTLEVSNAGDTKAGIVIVHVR